MQRNQQEIHNAGGQTHADEASASARVQENDLHQDLNHRETQHNADPQSHDDHQHNAAQEFQALLAESIERASAMDGLRLKLRRKATVYRIVAFIAVLLGLLVVMYPMFFQSYSAYKFAMLAEESNRQVAEWPYPEGELALQQAREYNQNLERSGPHNIGELNDPYSSSEHGNDVAEAFGELVGVGNQLGSDGGQQSAVPSERSTSENDEEYMNILNQGSGVIGSVEVP
jgi:sortase A